MNKIVKVLVIVITLQYFTFVGCGLTYSAKPANEMSYLELIAASPDKIELYQPGTQQLDITVIYADGKTNNVTEKCTYESSDEGTITVSAGGGITGLLPGSAIITVTYTEGDVTKMISVPVYCVESCLAPGQAQ